MMHFTILCVGKIKETYLQAAVADYVSRLSKYVRIDVIEVAEENHPLREKRIEKEGESLLRKIAPNSCVVALDLHGREISSEKACVLSEWENGFRKFRFYVCYRWIRRHQRLCHGARSLASLPFSHDVSTSDGAADSR